MCLGLEPVLGRPRPGCSHALWFWLQAWPRGQSRQQDLIRAVAWLGSLQAGPGALGSPRYRHPGVGLGACVLIFDSSLPQTTGELIVSCSCLKILPSFPPPSSTHPRARPIGTCCIAARSALCVPSSTEIPGPCLRRLHGLESLPLPVFWRAPTRMADRHRGRSSRRPSSGKCRSKPPRA